MKKLIIGILFFGFLCLTLNAKTYATVDGKAITDQDLEIVKQAIPNLNFNKLSTQEKEALINQLIDRQLILKAAKQEKLDTSKEYTEVLNAIKDNLLVDL